MDSPPGKQVSDMDSALLRDQLIIKLANNLKWGLKGNGQNKLRNESENADFGKGSKIIFLKNRDFSLTQRPPPGGVK